jgi:hypothetical protein
MSRRLFSSGITSLIFAIVLVAAAREANAYPQFQFSSGTNRCSQCHFSPAGGGLLTSWGRDESGDTISRGGDGAFLHGLVSPPSWLGIGGDFRYAVLRNDVGSPDGPDVAAFPMQGDVYVRTAFGESWSLNLTGGVRGVVRPEDPSASARVSTSFNRLVTREHYLMWRPSATGPYARVGRFFAPYGLRFAEHTYYVRRYNGFNLYEETYNASGGYVADDWEVHATVFTPVPPGLPDPLRSVGTPENGFAAYGELRLAKTSAIGAQTLVGIGDLMNRFQGGLVGKLWIDKAKTLFLGQTDLIRQQFKKASYGQTQSVSYLGVNFFPTRGLMGGLAYERFQENLGLSRTAHNAFDFQINVFPWAHVEVLLLGRYQVVGSGTTDGGSASVMMMQLHYYL